MNGEYHPRTIIENITDLKSISYIISSLSWFLSIDWIFSKLIVITNWFPDFVLNSLFIILFIIGSGVFIIGITEYIV